MSSLRGDNQLTLNYRSLLRNKINRQNRSRLMYDPSNPISIISSNCIGGVISHELGLRFESPTVNLFFYPDSYIEYISHLEDYSKQELIEIKTAKDVGYPIGQLGKEGKVIIHFMHYNSFEDARNKWIERTSRINFNNLYFILAERDGITHKQMKAFDCLPYVHKVLLACNQYDDIKCSHYLGEGYRKDGQLMDLLQYKGRFTGKRFLDDFDYVGFLNGDTF